MTAVLGVDLSLTGTGVAYAEGVTAFHPRTRGIARLHEISDHVLRAAQAHADTLVVIEGYAFSARNSQAHSLGELGGVVRYRLWRRKIAWIDVPPATLKKVASGRGNAPKELMLAEAIRRLGYRGSSFDEADALWLRVAGCELVGEPITKLPAVQVAALDHLRGVLPHSQAAVV